MNFSLEILFGKLNNFLISNVIFIWKDEENDWKSNNDSPERERERERERPLIMFSENKKFRLCWKKLSVMLFTFFRVQILFYIVKLTSNKLFFN